IPKIQTSAATLITSGTVTKNPAMKLRRSHCIRSEFSCRQRSEQDESGQDAIPREWGEPRSPDEAEERPYDQRRCDKRHHEANGDLGRPLRGEIVLDLEQI